MSFLALQKKVFECYFQGNYAEALEAALQAHQRFPEHFYRSSFWAACLYCLTGRPDEALQFLREAVEKGAWWSEQNLSDEDLAPLYHREEFIQIAAVCRERRAEAAQVSAPDLFILEPESPCGNRHSLLLALHGGGGEMKNFSAFWNVPAIRDSFVLAFPQSSQICGFNQYCWDDRELARKEIGDVYDRLAVQYDLHPNATILCGYSQGGALAIETALSRAEYAGFIAVVPALSEVEPLVGLLREYKGQGRGCILTGDKDFGYAKTLELAEALRQHQFPCKVVTVSGMGHMFPDHFPELLPQAVRFIETGGTE